MTNENDRSSIPFEAGISPRRNWNWFEYHSALSYRYASPEMKRVWSEGHKAELSADVWIAVASAQNKVGLVTDEQLADLQEHKRDFVAGIDEMLSRERDRSNPNYSGHDIIAATSWYGEVAKIGGGIVHRPMTSEDLLSNVEALQMKEGTALIDKKMHSVLKHFGEKIDQYKELPALGQTHMQAGEPVTLGLRLAVHAVDFLLDYQKLQFVNERILGKGIKGPVGTMAEVETLLEGIDMDPFEHEKLVMDELGLRAFPVTNQTYPRKMTADVVGALGDIGVSVQRFGLNMRLYQSSLFDELAEPRSSQDRGSSAMPHKRNPVGAENAMALGRGIRYKHSEAQEIAANVVMERGIDDSAGKRSFLPESFLALDEALTRVDRIVAGLVVNETSIWRNLHTFSEFTISAPIMALMTREGISRQDAHEKLAVLAGEAFETFRSTNVNDYGDRLLNDPLVMQYVTAAEIKRMIDIAEKHIGRAPQICEGFLSEHLYPALAK